MDPIYIPNFRNIRWRWIFYATSTFITAGVIFAFFQEVELKQDVPCEIVSPDEIKIQGLSGLVSEIYIESGAQVQAGAPLFRLDRDFSLSSDGRQRSAFNEQMKNEQIRNSEAQYHQRKASLMTQLDTARSTLQSRNAEMSALNEQMAQTQQIVKEAQNKVARLESVADYVVTDRIEQARAEMHQSKVSLAQGAARRQQIAADMGALQSNQESLTAQLKELDVTNAQNTQNIEMRYEQTRQEAVISAPQAGRLTFSGLVQGRVLDPSDVALVITTSNKNALRAALRIPSRQRGFVREGQTVRLKFDAFPYAKFGTYEARIDSISRTTVGASLSPLNKTPEQMLEPENKGASTGDYMAWATLSGHTFDYGKQKFEILPGMKATGSVVVEHRTVAEWVLEPLFRMWRN